MPEIIKPEPCEICGTTANVDFIADPYRLVVMEETEMRWLCEDCEQDRRDSI